MNYAFSLMITLNPKAEDFFGS